MPFDVIHSPIVFASSHDYGVGLKDYLVGQFPELEGKGFDGEHGVTFKLIMSTAAANSRMILSQMLICPPRSPSCLFPSVAKRNHVNKALVLDDPSWMKSVEFMCKSPTGELTLR